MDKNELKKKAVNLIKNFLKDYKLHSIDVLGNFSFWNIENDNNYNCYPKPYDGDRSVLAAYVLTMLQEGLRFLQDFRLLFYPIILIIVMIFRPQGLLGTNEFKFTKIPEYREWIKSLFKKFSKKNKTQKTEAEK